MSLSEVASTRAQSVPDEDFRAGVWMQTLLRDPAAGVMHSCIYFGFIGLFMATVILEIDHQLPGSLKFLHGGTYEGFSFGVNYGVLIALVKTTGMEKVLAQAIANAVGMPVNFLGQKLWSFKE